MAVAADHVFLFTSTSRLAGGERIVRGVVGKFAGGVAGAVDADAAETMDTLVLAEALTDFEVIGPVTSSMKHARDFVLGCRQHTLGIAYQ